MTVVKINAITVPDGAGPELEARFAQGCMNDVPGFLGYQLLRPIAGDTRYFVYTRWDSDAAFQAWRANGTDNHCDASRPQVGIAADLLEFEVITPVQEGTTTA